MNLAVTMQGSGRPVVLLHGLFGRGRNLLALQAALAAKWLVVALDLRNHGKSPHAPGMDYPTLAADVLETLDGLGIQHAALVGHSMGGKVAMRVALDHPARVSRIAVLDIAPMPYASTLGRYTAAMQALPLTPGLTRREADRGLAAGVPDAATRAFLLQNFIPGAQPGWTLGLDFIAAAMADLMGWQPVPPAFTGPALFIAGALSAYIDAAGQAAITTQFPGAALSTLAEAGHWLHVDQPAALLTRLREFLAA